MPLDWTIDPLAQGLRCFERRQFFDAHEHWEGVWLQASEPDKTFLQALIQTTAAFHHLERGNRVGATSLLRAALGRLEPYPPAYGGVEVAPLRESLRVWLDALERPGTPALPFPTIR